jgi:Protein of unknown function (DUF1091)
MVKIIRVLSFVLLFREFNCKFIFEYINGTEDVNRNYMHLQWLPPTQNNTHNICQYNLTRDLPNLFLHFKVHLLGLNFELVDFTFNVCQLQRNRRRSVIIRAWTEYLFDQSNGMLDCPLKKGYFMCPEKSVDVFSKNAEILPSFLRINDSVKVDFGLLVKTKQRIVQIYKSTEFHTYKFF